MKQFAVKPEIFMCDTCKEFCDEYKIGKGDLILSNEYIFEPYFSQYVSGATVVYVEKYGTGEPSDEMVEAIYADIKNCYYRRVFAIGGGTIIDVSKLFALEKVSPVLDLYDHKIPAKKGKELFILPTTCGTPLTSTAMGPSSTPPAASCAPGRKPGATDTTSRRRQETPLSLCGTISGSL